MSNKRFSHGHLGTTFNPGNHFISTRVQKMVPLFDVDINEMDDIRRHHTEMLWKLLFGRGPAVIVMKEWDKSRGTFTAYKSEIEQGNGNPRDYIPFAPMISGENDNLVLHQGDYYWDGYWIHSPQVDDLEKHMAQKAEDIKKLRKVYVDAKSGEQAISPVKKISKVLSDLTASTQVCVLAVHAWKYLYTPEENGNLKRPVGGGSDSMPTCSRVKLDWTFRFLQIDDFQKFITDVRDRSNPPFNSKQGLCPLKQPGEAPQEVVFPLYAFQIKNRKLKAIIKTQSNLLTFQEWGRGGTYKPQTFQKAYEEIGKVAEFSLDKIYIQRLRNMIMGKA